MNCLNLVEKARQIAQLQHVGPIDGRMLRILVHLEEDAVTASGRNGGSHEGRNELPLASGGVPQSAGELDRVGAVVDDWTPEP